GADPASCRRHANGRRSSERSPNGWTLPASRPWACATGAMPRGRWRATEGYRRGAGEPQHPIGRQDVVDQAEEGREMAATTTRTSTGLTVDQLLAIRSVGGSEAPQWSPDGGAIAVASNAFGTFDIFRIEVPSGATRKLTTSPLYEVYPYFTPDGRILYVRLNDAWTDHDVILVNGDGSEPRVVLRDTDF